nr:MAG: putative RNA-dependent RNA polymerase [Yunnan farmland cysto-like virus]
MVTPTFRPGDPVCDALFVGPKAERNRDKQFREGPIDPLPGIMSNDWDFLLFKDRASRELTKRIPPSVDDRGRVHGNGIRSNFHGIRHVNGYPMRPATFPITDNTGLREQEGLLNSFEKPWHREVLEALIELFFSDLQPQKVKIRKASSSVVPYFTTNITERLNHFRRYLITARQAGELMLKGDFQRAYEVYDFGGAYFIVYRRQSSDKIDFEDGIWVAKERRVADLEYAITGGRKGHYSPASKELGDVGFRVPDGFFRERNRTAFGGPWAINSALMPIAHPVRIHIYGEYAYTYHHTTRESIQADLRQWRYTIAADVTNHDQFWPPFVLDVICETLLRMGFAEWWVAIYRVKSQLPYYVTDVDEGVGNILLGDWRNPSNQGGLPSGHGFTDLEGTLLMTWVYFLVQVEHTYPEIIPQLQSKASAKAVLHRYLKGGLPIRLKDKSDDALLGWTTPELVARARALHAKMQKGEPVSRYMKVSYEHGGAFLGNVLLYAADGDDGSLVLIGNGNSLVTNMFSPEYGVQAKVADRSRVKRPFPGLAWSTLSQVYGTVPVYSEIMEIIEETWFSVYGESYQAMRRDMQRRDELLLAKYVREVEAKVGLNDLTTIDREVLAEPDKLQYKYVETDVNPEVTDLLFQGLTVEEITPFFNEVVP